MKNKEKLINRLLHNSQVIPDTISVIDELFSSLPDDIIKEVDKGLYVSLEPDKLRIEMPYNMPTYRKLRRALGTRWTYLKRHFNEYMGAHFIYFRHKKFDDISISIVLNLGGISDQYQCKLVVDHYRKPEPVYRMECR